jgi:hypothetical protein
MTDKISKHEMLALIDREWQALADVQIELDREAMSQPGVESEWSVKDILAHIAAWERLMVQWLEESLRGETPNRPAPGQSWDDLDLFNEQLYLENKHKSLDDVRQESADIHARAVKIIGEMNESDLLDPHRFEWRKGDPIWHLVAGNTWIHYEEHRQTISRWISGKA